MSKKIQIIPAVLSPDFKEIKSIIERSTGIVNSVQIDICDGIFTDYLTWPFTKKGVPEVAPDFEMPGWQELSFEADMLVKNPHRYIEDVKNLGFTKVVLHVGSEPQERLIKTARELSSYDIEIGIGVAIKTPIPEVVNICQSLSQNNIPFYFQVMGIEKIGVQGQKFSEKCLAIVKYLHSKYPDIIIQIDGGVGDASIKKLYSAGAVRFVVGSWFTKSSLGIREGVSVLKNLIY